MSIVERQSRQAVGVRVNGHVPARMLHVRWTLSLPALLHSASDNTTLAGALKEWGKSGPEPVLEWTVEESPDPGNGDPLRTAGAVLRGPGSIVALFESTWTTRVEIVEDSAAALRHVEVRENGEVLLSAALDAADGATMYARTALLERLGLGGGRYEVTR